MVFIGKPSKACAECRSRRTKCNMQKPTCSQCIRAGRSCWGYIDASETMFRNENAKFTDLTRTAPFGAPPTQKGWSSTPYFMSPTLPPSLEEQAKCFFFQNFVLEDYCASRGHFDYLPGIYMNLKIHKFLEDAVVALGLAGLANRTKAAKVMLKANLRYTAAVHAVSTALGEVEQAKADQTLITVMLLSLYETVASEAPRSLRSWTQHTKGATSILRLRGEEQLHSEVGRRLFVQLRSQVIATCLQRRLAVPEEIQEWSQTSKQYESIEELSASNMAEIAMQLCFLRSTMSDFDDHNNSVSIVSQALVLDTQFAAWVSELPPRYFYNTVTIFQRCDDVFSGHYHVYNGICIATSWNNYRCLRIILNEILIEQMIHLCQVQLEFVDPNIELIDFYRAKTQACQTLVRQLTIDLCASVPFYFSYDKKDGQTQVQVPTMSGNLLLWCLYTAAVAGNISDTMRVWIIEKLKAIYEIMGIRQALGLIEVLSEKREITVWEVGMEALEVEGDAEWFVNTREVLTPEQL